ncbi:MAG: hypothetical protein R3E32_18300 [Chitinophagales bacterium]
MTTAVLFSLLLFVLLHKPLHDLILGYSTQKLDWLHNEEDIFGSRISSQLEELDQKWGSRWLVPCGFVLLSCLCYPYLNWQLLDSGTCIRPFVLSLMGILVWKYVLTDIDLVTRKTLCKERILLIFSTIGVYFFPAMMVVFLFTSINYFKGWLHHNHLPIRMLQCVLTFLIVLGGMGFVAEIGDFGWTITPSESTVTCLVLLFAVYATHYWIPAAKKVKISTWKYPWVFHNRLHFIVASAYTWGWLQFLPEQKVLKLLKYLKKINVPLQLATLFFEASTLFLLLHPYVASVVIVGIGMMHVFIFLSTGILFWEYIFTNLLLLSWIHVAGAELIAALFTWQNELVFLLLAVVLPLTHIRLWRPNGLGWWDAPFAGRIHWEVVGESGKVYGLYNDFLDPHERLFGRIYAWFLTDRKIPYGHLGEVNQVELRNRIVDSKGNKATLQQIEVTFGKSHKDIDKEKWHDIYLQKFFQNFNKGCKKHILPKGWRFLKPLGGQYYYWGKEEAFRGQEKVRQVNIFFRSSFYDGEQFLEISNEWLKTIDIKDDF